MVFSNVFESKTLEENLQDHLNSIDDKYESYSNMDRSSNFFTFSNTTKNYEATSAPADGSDHHKHKFRKAVDDGVQEKASDAPTGLRQVMQGFLESTSLHGCKNVMEKGIVNRIFWFIAIVSMTFILVSCLVSLVLRYLEYPFVSVWAFKREESVLAPAVTFCIPSKFHRSKVSNSSQAFKMLVMNTIPGYDAFENAGTTPQPQNVFENEMWRKELDNITVNCARNYVGFSTSAVVLHGEVRARGRHIKVFDELVQFEGAFHTCWTIDYVSRNVGGREGTCHSNKDEVSNKDREYEQRGEGGRKNTTTITYDNNTKSDNVTPVVALLSTFDGTEGNPMTEERSEFYSTKYHPSTTASLFTQHEPTAASVSLDPAENYFLSTPLPSSSRASSEDDQRGEKSAPSSGSEENGENTEQKKPSLLRMSMGHMISFTVNLNQHEWLGEPPFGGLQLYLHHQKSAFWTSQPIQLRPGTHNRILFQNINYKFLPPPFKSFSAPGEQNSENNGQDVDRLGCVDTKASGFKNPMRAIEAEFYKKDLCMIELVINKTVAKCGCVGDWREDSNVYGVKECSIFGYYSCYLGMFGAEYVKVLNQIAIAKRNGNASPEEILCPQECEESKIKVSVSSGDFPPFVSMRHFLENYNLREKEIRDNFLVFSVHPESLLAETIEHVPEMTLLQLVGSIGGYMGLCLGASLLSLSELLQAGASCLWVIVCKLLRKLRLVEKERC